MATLQEIGQDWGQRLEKGLDKVGCCFFWHLFGLFIIPPFVCHHHRRMEEQKEVEEGHLLEKKKTSGRLPGITEEMVQKYYHYPVSAAAELLGAELGYPVDCRNLKRRL